MEAGLWGIGGALIGALVGAGMGAWLTWLAQRHHYEMSERRRLGMDLMKLVRVPDQFDRRVHDIIFVYKPTSQPYKLYLELLEGVSKFGEVWSFHQRHKIVSAVAVTTARETPPPNTGKN